MVNQPTIKDVAEWAGCSIATVSRVLNNSGPTSLEMRRRVDEAVETLGFQFNEMSRSLKSNQTKTLAVLIPTLINPVFADAIEGVQEASQHLGYEIILICSNYDADLEYSSLKTLISKQVDGVLLTVSDPENSAALDLLDELKIPHCLIFNHHHNLRHMSVGVDNKAAARLVGAQLLEFGHTNAAFIAVHFKSSDRSKSRYKGFCETYIEGGFSKPELLEVDYAPQDLAVSLAHMLTVNPEITAFFASNDLLALACINALRSLGKSVPDDISVVGFDGIAIADLVQPKLATVSTPCRTMGRTAAKLLISSLTEKEASGADNQSTLITLPFEFRPGESLATCQTKNADERAATPSSAVFTTPPDLYQMK